MGDGHKCKIFNNIAVSPTTTGTNVGYAVAISEIQELDSAGSIILTLILFTSLSFSLNHGSRCDLTNIERQRLYPCIV